MLPPRLFPFLAPTAGMMLMAFCAGCGQTSEPPAPIPISEAPTGVRSAFAGAPSALRQEAEAAADGIAGGDYVGSLGRLQMLSSSPDLSPEQLQALAQSRTAVITKLNEAAAAGDARAAAAMETYRGSR
ncbi:MAG: hypothetical protein KIT22_11665 [Verrucomicrobiae bacterium]|nr:hypothetical protein [Verrucomicrobiae bacterium]